MPVKIEGIVTDEMYEFLREGINTDEFYKENSVEFIMVDKFSEDANIRIISAEKLIERGTTEGIPDYTLLVDNSEINDIFEMVILNKDLIQGRIFILIPEIFGELPDYIRKINK